MIGLGLIGYPVEHSLSPRIHTAALRSCGLQGSYSLFPVRPDDLPGLKHVVDAVRSGKLQGLNVTIPHKQSVIELLDELTPTARAVGAVNTIYRQDKRLIGDNTDAPGFLTDLKRVFHPSSFPLPPSALVLGAGGSARAVAYALQNDGWKVAIASRRLEQANRLAASFPDPRLPLTGLSLSESTDLQILLPDLDLIVNTTPLGMAPEVDRSPWPEHLDLPAHAAIYDLVYNPRETKLVRQARARGLAAATGLGMLIEQAILSFTIWTGCRPSREVISVALHAPISEL